MKQTLRIVPFKGNYQELAGLIQRTWPNEHRSFIKYTPEYLEYLITSPDTLNELTLGAYVDGKLVGFLLSKQKKLIINKKSYKTLLNTLATTDPNFASLFPYIKIKDLCVNRAIMQGFDLNCGFAAWGIGNNDIEVLYADKKKLQCVRVNSFGTLVRGLESGQRNNKLISQSRAICIRDFTSNDFYQCIDIMKEEISQKCNVFEKLEKKSHLTRLTPSKFAQTIVVEYDGLVSGLINYTILTLVYKNIVRKTAIIYNYFLQRLCFKQKLFIMTKLCKQLNRIKVDAISFPNTGYFDEQDLKKMGFIEIPFKSGKTNFYITSFHKQLELNYPCPFYMEII
jgi:hypothetical protein